MKLGWHIPCRPNLKPMPDSENPVRYKLRDVSSGHILGWIKVSPSEDNSSAVIENYSLPSNMPQPFTRGKSESAQNVAIALALLGLVMD